MQQLGEKLLYGLLPNLHFEDFGRGAHTFDKKHTMSLPESGLVKFSQGDRHYLVSRRNLHKADHIEVCESLEECFILKNGDSHSVYHKGCKIFESDVVASCSIIVTDASRFIIDTDTQMYLYHDTELIEVFEKTA